LPVFSSFMARMASSYRMAPLMTWLKVQLKKGISCSQIMAHNPLQNRVVFFAYASMWCEPYCARYMNYDTPSVTVAATVLE
jgi:hypothetical protein